METHENIKKIRVNISGPGSTVVVHQIVVFDDLQYSEDVSPILTRDIWKHIFWFLKQ